MDLNTKYRNQIIEHRIEEQCLDKYDFANATFVEVNAKGKSFRYCDFYNLTIGGNKKTDFSDADLTNVLNLDTVKNLHRAKFNDNTKLDGIELEKLAQHDPISAHKLKQIRYIGRIKRENKWLYLPWKMICDCGRSWVFLLGWAIAIVVFFGCIFYFCGISCIHILPHINFVKDTGTQI